MSPTEIELLIRILTAGENGRTPSLAAGLLRLDFSSTDHRRIEELSYKAQVATLTPEERSELEGYIQVNDFLAILHSKLRQFIRRDAQQSTANPAADHSALELLKKWDVELEQRRKNWEELKKSL